MIKRLYISLGGCAFMLALLVTFMGAHVAQAEPQANTYIVDRNDDPEPIPGACTGASDDCSLRGAIIAANADPGSIVLLAPSTYTLTIPKSGNDDATSGDLNIITDTSIARFCLLPPCANATISGGVGWNSRIFLIEGGAKVSIGSVTMRNGNSGSVTTGGGILIAGGALTLTNSTLMSNTATIYGGGLYIGSNSTVLLTNSIVMSNTSGSRGAGIDNGGGLTIVNSAIISNTAGYASGLVSDGKVTMIQSTVQGNRGGLYNQGTMILTGTLVQSNTSGNDGGGIYNGGVLTVTNGMVRGNSTSASGGGIFNPYFSYLTVINSTIANNHGTRGAGIFNYNAVTVIDSVLMSNTGDYGGGFYVGNGVVAMTNTTLSGNRVNSDGGGIYYTSTFSSTLNNVTIAFNTADVNNNGTGNGGGIFQIKGGLALKGTLLADNIDKGTEAPDCNGTLFSQGYNLIADMTACSIGGDTTNNLLNVDPVLGPLQDNGGDTFTHALLDKSLAIDTGPLNGCPASDQRGVARPIGARCDIGAFESSALPPWRVFLPLVLR